VKRTGSSKSIGVVIHICIGTTQGNSLCGYLYIKLAKCHASLFIFCFFFYKIGEQEDGTGWEGGRHSWEGERCWGKG
jgi:hypothetical protein